MQCLANGTLDVEHTCDSSKLIVNSRESYDDAFSLGIHLVSDHSCLDKSDFNKVFRVFILENCSPASLEVKEHKYIHKFKTLKPFGLNSANPFSIPLLH